MKHILNIAYTSDFAHFDEVIDFMGERFRLTQLGTNFDFEATLSVLEKYDGLCDAISISGLPAVIKTKKNSFTPPQREALINHTRETFVLDGQTLKDIYIPWLMRKHFMSHSEVYKHERLAFYSGVLQKNLLDVCEEFVHEVQLADPYFFLKMPYTIKSVDSLESFTKLLWPIFKRMKIKRSLIPEFNRNKRNLPASLTNFFHCDTFVGTMAILELIDLEHTRGKKVIVDVLGAELKEKLINTGTKEVLVCLPQIEGVPFINFAILEAFFQAKQKENIRLTTDDFLKRIEEINIRPELLNLNDLQEPVQAKTRFHSLTF